MTVRENMGFALKLAKTPQAEIDMNVSEAARVLDLEQHLDRKPANLSGGQSLLAHDGERAANGSGGQAGATGTTAGAAASPAAGATSG